MTLNITVATDRCIYQCADYRLQDIATKKTFDYQAQKLALINTGRWSATVCFAGVGQTPTLDVSDWLADRLAAIQSDDPFGRLLDELMTADSWLSAIPSPYRKHSFSVGAFVGSNPIFALISNFEDLDGPPLLAAKANLSISTRHPTKPTTFVSGQGKSVFRGERRKLAALVGADPAADQVYAALAVVNRAAAKRTILVSPACFTAHVRLTGEGGGCVHDIGNRPFMPKFARHPIYEEAIKEILDKEFGPGPTRMCGISFARSEPTDDYHQVQLREKPSDPSTHSNYGVYLKDVKKDIAGAERAYRKAIQLDPNFVNALGNLGSLLWERGDPTEGAILYRRALQIDPGNESVTWNYARYLSRDTTVANSLTQAIQLLSKGILAHPDSSRLFLLRADLQTRAGTALAALEDYRMAREKGANQKHVETGYAFSLQMSGAPAGDCIAAYRVAIALNPKESNLHLNLAQLLFLKGYSTEGTKELQKALALGLSDSAQLEAQFYMLSHTHSDPTQIFQAIKQLLNKGMLLRWNVQPNIDAVRGKDPHKSDLLSLLSKVMEGKESQSFLDNVLANWN